METRATICTWYTQNFAFKTEISQEASYLMVINAEVIMDSDFQTCYMFGLGLFIDAMW